MDEFLTPIELMNWLKISKRQLYDLVQKDRIPFYRVGRLLRFERAKIKEWMNTSLSSH